jgi:hypothetical protein
MHSTATVPKHVTLKPSSLSLLLVASVAATATITWGLIATVDSESSGPAPAAQTNSEILEGLSPSAREYVEGLTTMTPEQLVAAYGYGPLPASATPTRTEILDRLSPSAREYVEGIMTMTPEQLNAAYGYGAVSAPATPTNSEILDGLSPSAREYVEGLMTMTPEQLAAAYGYNWRVGSSVR